MVSSMLSDEAEIVGSSTSSGYPLTWRSLSDTSRKAVSLSIPTGNSSSIFARFRVHSERIFCKPLTFLSFSS